ncbi:MAG: TonB family protein [Gammaproteobacteria bacterium]|nr:TonB family protein [Gammaproteobacteria bacterium]
MRKRRTIQVNVTDHDRFGMTFFLATIFHGIVILGVSFSIAPSADSKTSPALDIILVQTQSPNDVEDVDYLAQVSQQGGGNAEEKARPQELFSAPTLASEPGISKQTSVKQQQQQKHSEQLALLSQADASYAIHSEKNTDLTKDNITVDKTTLNNTQAARLAAEISNIIEQEASVNKTQYLNSSTKAFTPAKYMRQWINRVERVGNLNYPDQARRNKLSGTLILDVVISADGKLLKTDLRQSSGHQILDDAAKRIVKLAAPFSAFPKKLRQEADVIHITRSWEFLNNSRIRTH